MPTTTLTQLHITIAKPNSITPFNQVKYLITTKSGNQLCKTYIFARQQPTLLLALTLKRYSDQANQNVSIVQIENLFTNAKLFPSL